MQWRLTVVAIGLVLACGAAGAEDIGSVLRRSQQLRLDHIELTDADSAAARRVRGSFERLLHALHELAWPGPVELRVSAGATPAAETLRGNVVVAGVALADLTEAERLFILAHELGHVQLGHASQMGVLYRKWIPGEVVQQQTDAVAPLLGRDAAGLSHRHEFEADAFAMRALLALGFNAEDTIGVFRRAASSGDTATHPATRRRIAALMAIAAGSSADAPAADAPAADAPATALLAAARADGSR